MHTLDETGMQKVLITFHGTLVCFDPVARRLQHAPIGSCEANVYVTLSGADAQLLWDDGEKARRLGYLGPDVISLAVDGGSRTLAAIPVGPSLVAFYADGRYLCAEPGGAIGMLRLKAGIWESFLLIDVDDLVRLEHIVANRWLSHSTRQFSGPPTNRCVASHMIEVGGAAIPIRDAIDAAKTKTTDVLLPRDLFLTYDGWKVAHFVLYRPLVYLVAYGKEEIFQCAEIAIRSLFDFGQWDGDVLVITDASNLNFVDRIPSEMRGRVRVEAVPAHDLLDYTLARYKIVDIKIAEMYQPVIYIDIDVVCDAPLGGLLQEVVLSRELQVCAEFPLGRPLSLDADVYGQSLMATDGMTFDPQKLGFSSGIFAFRSTEEQRILFRLITSAAYRFTSSAGRRNTHRFYDQPFFNYILSKTASVGTSFLTDVVESYFNHRPPLTAPVRKGLVHFAGGVGNSTPKLTHMTSYVKLLDREKTGCTTARGLSPS